MPDPLDLPFIWCVVANVTRDPHPEGPDGELRLGLKRFAPGAKVYCFPIAWGDGGERMRVLGRHRRGSKLIDIIIATKWLTNWRVSKVFHPFVVETMRLRWDDSDKSRDEAESIVASRR
jgi:hypothetical protein